MQLSSPLWVHGSLYTLSGPGRPGPGVGQDVEYSVFEGVAREEAELGEDDGGEEGVSHGGGGGRCGGGLGTGGCWEEEHQGQA